MMDLCTRTSFLLSILTLVYAANVRSRREEVQQIQFADLKFTTDLYSLLRRDRSGEDLFFSPFSIASALAILRVGARGATEEQIRSGLGLSSNLDDAHRTYNSLAGIINESSGNVTLEMANKLYADSRGFDVADKFNATLIASYDTNIERLNFADSEGARNVINNWVLRMTRNKIRDLIPAGGINPLTKMVIANAIYFKGDWAQEFNEAATQPGDFHISELQTVRVDMMRIMDDIAVAEFNDAYVVDLPYKGNKIVMTLVVPKSMSGLSAIENRLQGRLLSDFLSARRRTRKVQLMMPKFKIESAFGIKKFLTEMGMRDMFSPGLADLSGITPNNVSLFVDEGYHKAFVEVNEKGTEAAAATGLVIQLTSLFLPEVEIAADRPFIFAIRHRDARDVLFFGCYKNPEDAMTNDKAPV